METPLLDVRNLGYVFGEGALAKRVLRDISIQFQREEIVIIMGPSGSGKTTFLSLAGALRAPQEGSVHFAGRDYSALRPSELVLMRREIGFVFQSHNLIASLTALENTQFPLQFDPQETAATSQAKALEMLRVVGLADHAHKLPRELSGGQRQRVAIARALIRMPRLILADEPTASLDKDTGREIVDILRRLASQFHCGILVVTHDHRILDIADRIVLLEDGVMEDFDDRVESLWRALADLFDQMSQGLQSPETGAGAASRFARTLETLEARVNDLSHLKTRASLARRMETLQLALGQTRLLHDSLLRFADLAVANPPGHLRALADRFLQALDALLLSTGDAIRHRALEDVRTLDRLTQDRRAAMARLRDTYFEAQQSQGEEGRIYLFELTNTFSRAVYLLNSLAALLKA